MMIKLFSNPLRTPRRKKACVDGRHEPHLLVIPNLLLEEVSLPLQGIVLHDVEWVLHVANLQKSQGKHSKSTLSSLTFSQGSSINSVFTTYLMYWTLDHSSCQSGWQEGPRSRTASRSPFRFYFPNLAHCGHTTPYHVPGAGRVSSFSVNFSLVGGLDTGDVPDKMYRLG